MNRLFFKYVSQSVAGMVGLSIYILADTFFISLHSGTNGITILNLVLPLYGCMFAIGSLIGIGSATRYTLCKAQRQNNADFYFTHALSWQIIFSIPFVITGLFAPNIYLHIMGGDANIIQLGIGYTRIIFVAAPFFMMNYTFTAFVRNDNAPTVAMIGSLAGSAFNVVFDYIFMFPTNLGMEGAALATALSPVVTMFVCCKHYFSKACSLKMQWRRPSIKRLFLCAQLGISAFIGEMSSSITTITFNTLILGISGNIGLASYGVIANLSLVVMSVFNGVSQGMQPLLSMEYGRQNLNAVKQILRLGLAIILLIQCAVLFCAWGMTDTLVSIFNSEGSNELAIHAHSGLRLYFLGYIFAGINILLATYFAAIDRAKMATIISILRGAVAIIGCAIILSKLFAMTGVWLSFFASECLTFVVVLMMMKINKRNGAGKM